MVANIGRVSAWAWCRIRLLASKVGRCWGASTLLGPRFAATSHFGFLPRERGSVLDGRRGGVLEQVDGWDLESLGLGTRGGKELFPGLLWDGYRSLDELDVGAFKIETSATGATRLAITL